MTLDEIALEIARSMFILSAERKKREVTLFLTNINDCIEREQEWINMPICEKEKHIENAKIYLESLKYNLPLVYDIIINRIIPSNDRSINYLLHGSSI